jgi:hypothetical protein
MKFEIIEAVEQFVKTLEQFNVAYYIGGSIASSVYGIARATMGVHMVSELKK